MKTFANLRDALESHLTRHLVDLDTPERVEALFTYCQGLGLEYPRKTLASMAERIEPGNAEGCRQRMHRAIHRGRFSKDDVFRRLQGTVWSQSEAGQAFCIDDTGFAKKGVESVGVQRQYSGTIGKVGNCQVAVSLHVASERRGVCIDAQLYLPEKWATDPKLRTQAGVPDDVGFATKGQIALGMLRRAREEGAPNLPVLADAGYGDSREFRDSIRQMGLHFAVAVSSTTNVWPSGANPQAPVNANGVGRPPSRFIAANGAQPVSITKLAQEAWEQGRFRSLTWRQGTKGPMKASFCALRVHSAERHTKGTPPSEEMWLLMERDEKQKTGFKYYFSSLPVSTSRRRLALLTKLRWRVERDYQDMKQQLGLDRYEGRTWGGFHRHFAMVALMHAFLSLYKEAFSPWGYATVDATSLPSCSHSSPRALAAAVPNLLQIL